MIEEKSAFAATTSCQCIFLLVATLGVENSFKNRRWSKKELTLLFELCFFPFFNITEIGFSSNYSWGRSWFIQWSGDGLVLDKERKGFTRWVGLDSMVRRSIAKLVMKSASLGCLTWSDVLLRLCRRLSGWIEESGSVWVNQWVGLLDRRTLLKKLLNQVNLVASDIPAKYRRPFFFHIDLVRRRKIHLHYRRKIESPFLFLPTSLSSKKSYSITKYRKR